MGSIESFEINVSEETINNIRAKVMSFPWGMMTPDNGWEYGANLDYMKELCKYWVEDFDWKNQESRLNTFSHFKANVEGMDVHFIREKGSGNNPTPLVINHGWPGSIAEFTNIIGPLAHPEQFGGDIQDAFDVITPSLPGFGYSDAPPRPYGPRKIAGVINKLMTDNLNYEKYIAQGGDWGAGV